MTLTTRSLLLVACASAALAADIYIAQVTAGSDTGADCANAHSAAWFNTAGNWGGGAGDIMPGDTVHLCGTFTGTAGATALTVQASGSSGNHITVLFEGGAVLTAPYWGNANAGAINMSGKSYITVDGGSNGRIENTANGTGLTHQQASIGVRAASGSNITIRNLTISNICQHTSTADENGCISGGNNDGGIVLNAVTDSTITGNTIDDTQNGIWITGTGALNLTISNNTISRCNWGIAAASTSGPVISGLTISGNDISDAANWDTALDTFHHNGIFLYASPVGSGYDGAVISGNYIHGSLSECSPNSCATGGVFLAPNQGSITGTLVYNNVFVGAPSTSGPSNGYITGLGTNGAAYNNTFACNAVGYTALKLDSSGSTLRNNIIANCPRGIYVNDGTTISASNTNVIYGLSAATSRMRYSGADYASVAAWTAATGFDVDSAVSDPLLSGTFGLLTGSPAIGAGANLTSLGITALNSDKAGVARPTSAAWDIGAYQFRPPYSHSHTSGTHAGGTQ